MVLAMTKQHFIALADVLKKELEGVWNEDSMKQYVSMRDALADFCQAQNPNFKRDRWIGYIEGECGPNGGAVKGRK